MRENLSFMHSLPFLSYVNQITWETYFARFFLVFWFLIFPILFLCIFLFTRELDRNKKSSVVFDIWKNFSHYGYFFHNVFFVFVIGAFSFNTIFLIYSFIDIYIVKFSTFYSMIFGLSDKSRNTVSEQHQTGFFWGVVFLGYFLNLISSFTYLYYNLYKTDSFFAESWRPFVLKYSSHPFVLSFKYRYPKIYSKFYFWFLDIENISKYLSNQKKFIID